MASRSSVKIEDVDFHGCIESLIRKTAGTFAIECLQMGFVQTKPRCFVQRMVDWAELQPDEMGTPNIHHFLTGSS